MAEEDLASKITGGEVVVLRAGAERETPNGFYAPATISLIKLPLSRSGRNCGQDTARYCLVDSGGFGEGKVIKKLLAGRRIEPMEIYELIITHNHPDHIGNAGLFKQSRVIMPDSIFHPGMPNYFELIPQEVYKKTGRNIQIQGLTSPALRIRGTPGHSGWDLSVFCVGKEGGVAIVGDLFWSEEDWEHDLEYSGLCVNPEMQKRSRDYARKLKPDVVVPGHGPAFAPKY